MATALEPTSSTRHDDAAVDAAPVEGDGAETEDASGARPLGWLFRAAQN